MKCTSPCSRFATHSWKTHRAISLHRVYSPDRHLKSINQDHRTLMRLAQLYKPCISHDGMDNFFLRHDNFILVDPTTTSSYTMSMVGGVA